MLGCKGLQEHFSQETKFPRTKLMKQLIQLILSSSKQMFCLIYDYQFRVMSLDDLCKVMNGLWMAQNLSQCCSFAQKCIIWIYIIQLSLRKNLRHISRKIQVIVSSVHDQPLAILKTLVTSFPNTCSQSVNKFYHESSTPQAIFTLFWFYKLKFFPDKCHESCCLIKKTYISGLVITAKFQDKKQNGY